MSTVTKVKLPHAEALALAESILETLRPGCERIEIAGSVRRKKPECGDIEIVAIPKFVEEKDLFGNPLQSISVLNLRLDTQDWHSIKNGQWYKQFDIGPCMLDLFLTTPEKWGSVFTIRTGSADFSHRLVTKKRLGGLCPAYMSFNDGRLWSNGQVLSTPEEADIFQALGIAWIPPEGRIK